jgi:hypothetical protein
MHRAQQAPPQPLPSPQREPGPTTFGPDELVNAGHRFFGNVSRGLASVIERAVSQWGLPNGYILGQEAGGDHRGLHAERRADGARTKTDHASVGDQPTDALKTSRAIEAHILQRERLLGGFERGVHPVVVDFEEARFEDTVHVEQANIRPHAEWRQLALRADHADS